MSAIDVVVGRQPIFDRSRRVMGYELLFRPHQPHPASPAPGTRMTAEVLFSSVSIGVDKLVGDKALFCNADRAVLIGAVPMTLPAERTVVEVLETVRPDEAVLAGCERLVGEGFTLALDDFVWFEGAEALLELAAIVKLDVRALSPGQVAELAARCRRFGVQLVAEKVETADELERYDALGFDYFQGYLLSRPQVVPGRALEAGRLTRLRLSAKLWQAEFEIAELEAIVRADPGMTHQLLQLAGVGPPGGLRRTVRTIREALVLVGWRRLQSWVALRLLADREGLPEEEVTTALARARMCELFAPHVGCSPAMAYTAGMISSLDLLLGLPLDQVITSLPLDPALRDAVLTGAGTLGALVRDITDHQLGRSERATRTGLPEHLWPAIAVGALTTAVETASSLGADGGGANRERPLTVR